MILRRLAVTLGLAAAPFATEAGAQASMCNDPTGQFADMTETDSGLKYKVIREGTGRSPDATDTVEVNYEGTLVDGTKFDSSYDRGQTIEFPLNGVIAGWTEGVQLMKEGAEYCFAIPSDLAYGARGIPGVIPGGATLVFRVELVAVK